MDDFSTGKLENLDGITAKLEVGVISGFAAAQAGEYYIQALFFLCGSHRKSLCQS